MKLGRRGTRLAGLSEIVESVGRRRYLPIFFLALLICTSPVFGLSVESDITEGASWLVDNQGADGSWDGQLFWSTSEAVLALQNQDIVDATEQIENATRWMESRDVESTEFFSRMADVDALLLLQNKDGGWGYSRYYQSNGIDTSLALEALKDTDSTAAIETGVSYLTKLQNTDGSYGTESNSDSIYTALASGALGKVSFRLLDGDLQFNEDAYKSGFESSYFLTQNLDLPAKNTEVAEALEALIYNGYFPERNSLANTLVQNQNTDGSWGFVGGQTGSAYPTARALQALEEYEEATGVQVQEMTLKNGGPIISPDSSVNAGESFTLSARISNTGEAGRTNVIAVGKIVKDGKVVKVISPKLIDVLSSSTTITADVNTDHLLPGTHQLIFEARDSEGRVFHAGEMELNVLETTKVRINNLDVSPSNADIMSTVAFYFGIENTGNQRINTTLEVKLLSPDPANPEVLWTGALNTTLGLEEHRYVAVADKLYTGGLGYGTYIIEGATRGVDGQLLDDPAIATLSIGPRVSVKRYINETEFAPGNSTASVNITIEGKTGKPPADVVILIDSTNESAQALEDVKDAVLDHFIDTLDRRDMVAVMSISDNATLLQGLTLDRSAARSAVSSISPESDVLNLGAGIDSAAAHLNESGRDDNNWYIFTVVRAPSFDDPLPAVNRSANVGIPTYMIVYAEEEEG